MITAIVTTIEQNKGQDGLIETPLIEDVSIDVA
jgi:hypothetical protein